MITLNNIISMLSDSNYEIAKMNTNGLNEFWYLKNLYKNMSANDSSVLYIVNYNDFYDNSYDKDITLLIIHDGNNLDKLNIESIDTVIYYNNNDNQVGLNKILEAFENQFKIGKLLSNIQKIIVENRNLQDIIEELSKFFEYPISLIDTSFRFMVKSKTHKPMADFNFGENVHEADGLNKMVIEQMEKDGIIDKFKNSTSYFKYDSSIDKPIYIPIFVRGIKVAYLTIYINDNDTKKVEVFSQYFDLIANMLSIEIANKEFYKQNKGDFYNQIFESILNKTNTDINDIRMRLNIYDYDLKEDIYLIQIIADSDLIIDFKKDNIASMLKNIFYNSFYVFDDNKLYFLMSRSKKHDFFNEEIERMKIALNNAHLIAVITRPFNDFHEIDMYMQEAQIMIDLVKRKKIDERVIFFNDIQVESMITILEKSSYLKMFLFKPFIELYKYDESNNTSLVNTLIEYLNHQKEISLICENLNIHKNTLYKRLDKISEIMQCDYRNGKIIMQIEFTYYILKLQSVL